MATDSLLRIFLPATNKYCKNYQHKFGAFRTKNKKSKYSCNNDED